jgi:hypothetical protein
LNNAEGLMLKAEGENAELSASFTSRGFARVRQENIA